MIQPNENTPFNFPLLWRVLVLLLLLTGVGGLAMAVEPNRKDSLEMELTTEKDSVRVRLFCELSKEWLQTDPKEASNQANKGLGLAQKLGRKDLECLAIRQLGIAQSAEGKYTEALESFNSALEKSRSLKQPSWVIKNLISAGNVSRKLSAYQEALAFYQEAALKARDEEDKQAEAKALCNVGVAHADQSNYAKAIEYCQQSIAIDKELGNQTSIAITLGNIAIYYAIQGDFKSGILQLQQALSINRRLNNREGMAYNLNNLGRMHADLGDPEKGIEYLLESKAINEERKDLRMVAYNLNNIGRLYLKLERAEDAIRFSLQSLDVASQLTGRGDWVTDAYQTLAEAFAKQGQHEKAFSYLELYTDLRDTLYTEESSAQIAEMEARFNQERQEQEIALLREQEGRSKAALAQEKAEGRFRLTIMWSSLIGFILMVALVIALVINYRRRIRTRELLAAKAEETRQKEASRQLAEMRLKALRSQMNPHFIFNVINSIQHFIMKADRKAGYNYLSKFARLMRVILESSQKSTVFLEEELKTLRLYLEIESLRFEDKFDYEIKLGESLNGTNYEMPAMLVQPYVENAIVHGLLNKNEKGSLLIEVSREEDMLHCVVQDNGVGRKKAQEIKKSKLLSHRSVGMSNTSDRLEILNLNRNTHTRVNIEDLIGEDGNASGTRVDLFIPIINE